MDWDDVRVFLAVARAGQFVAAARSLKVDHATATRRVTALECSSARKRVPSACAGASDTDRQKPKVEYDGVKVDSAGAPGFGDASPRMPWIVETEPAFRRVLRGGAH